MEGQNRKLSKFTVFSEPKEIRQPQKGYTDIPEGLPPVRTEKEVQRIIKAALRQSQKES